MREAHQSAEIADVLAALPYRNDRSWGVLPRRDQEFLDEVRARPTSAVEAREVQHLRAMRDWLEGR